MLGQSDQQYQLIEELWQTAAERATLPFRIGNRFFEPRGPSSLYYDNKRRYQRYFLRGKALLVRQDKQLGAYTKDVSRTGVGFISPVQLMPKERVQLKLPTADLHLEVARCKRIDQGCFDCGAKFAM